MLGWRLRLVHPACRAFTNSTGLTRRKRQHFWSGGGHFPQKPYEFGAGTTLPTCSLGLFQFCVFPGVAVVAMVTERFPHENECHFRCLLGREVEKFASYRQSRSCSTLRRIRKLTRAAKKLFDRFCHAIHQPAHWVDSTAMAWLLIGWPQPRDQFNPHNPVKCDV